MLNLTQKEGHFEWVRLQQQQVTHYKHLSHFVTKLRNIQGTSNTRKQSVRPYGPKHTCTLRELIVQ